MNNPLLKKSYMLPARGNKNEPMYAPGLSGMYSRQYSGGFFDKNEVNNTGVPKDYIENTMGVKRRAKLKVADHTDELNPSDEEYNDYKVDAELQQVLDEEAVLTMKKLKSALDKAWKAKDEKLYTALYAEAGRILNAAPEDSQVREWAQMNMLNTPNPKNMGISPKALAESRRKAISDSVSQYMKETGGQPMKDKKIRGVPKGFSEEDKIRLHGLGVSATMKAAWDKACATGWLHFASNRYSFSKEASDGVRTILSPTVAKVNSKLNRKHVPKSAAAHEAAMKAIAPVVAAKTERMNQLAALVEQMVAAEKPKCPHCGSSKFGLMPSDFETAKCDNCEKTWEIGIVPGINDPSDSKTASPLEEGNARIVVTVPIGLRKSTREFLEGLVRSGIKWAEKPGKLSTEFTIEGHTETVSFIRKRLASWITPEKSYEGEFIEDPVIMTRGNHVTTAAVATPAGLDVHYTEDIEPGATLPDVDEIQYVYYGPEYVDESPNDSDYYTIIGFKGGKGLFNVNVPAGRLKEVVGEHLAQQMALGQGKAVYPLNTTGVQRPFKSLVVHDRELTDADKDWLKEQHITAAALPVIEENGQ